MINKTTLAATAAVILSVLSGVAVAQTAAPAATAPAPTAAAPAAAPRQIDPAVAKFRAACKADMDKLCGAEVAAAAAARAAEKTAGAEPAKGQTAGAQTSGGRSGVTACMTTNEAKLSTECKTAWAERKATMKAKQG
jgi:hypothetical protein